MQCLKKAMNRNNFIHHKDNKKPKDNNLKSFYNNHDKVNFYFFFNEIYYI